MSEEIIEYQDYCKAFHHLYDEITTQIEVLYETVGEVSGGCADLKYRLGSIIVDLQLAKMRTRSLHKREDEGAYQNGYTR